MTKNSTSSTSSTWTGMVPVDDTALAVTDTGGPGIPVVYLNGQFATQGYWRRVIAELGTGWRHITYDERARGKIEAFGGLLLRGRRPGRRRRPRGQGRGPGAAGGLVLRGVRRRRTGPAGIRTAPWARSWSTARTRTTGSTRPWSSGSGSCSGG